MKELINDKNLAKIYSENKQDFLAKVNKIVGNQSFILQQFIPLSRTDQNKIYDIRMYVQKNGRGKWTATKGFSRIGQEDSYITNFTTEIKSTNEMLNENNLLTAEKLNKMGEISLQTAQAIENELGNTGEISVDFGIDHSGKPWIIEVNGRTQKKYIKRVNDDQLTKTIYLMPIKYALFLADTHK